MTERFRVMIPFSKSEAPTWLSTPPTGDDIVAATVERYEELPPLSRWDSGLKESVRRDDYIGDCVTRESPPQYVWSRFFVKGGRIVEYRAPVPSLAVGVG